MNNQQAIKELEQIRKEMKSEISKDKQEQLMKRMIALNQFLGRI